MFFFDNAGSGDHWGQLTGNAVGNLRKFGLGHDRPGRAAGGADKGIVPLNDFVDIVVGLLNSAQVSAQGHLDHIGKAQRLNGFFDLFWRCQRAKLAYKGRGDLSDDLIALLDGVDQLKNLGFICDGAKGAVDQAHAAGNTLVIIDLGASQLVALNGVDAAGRRAGPVIFYDGLVRAGLAAAPAPHAFFLVNMGFAILHVDGVYRTD